MADREKLIELINDHTCLEEKDNCAEECAVFPDGTVTHWMEKPQLPKEDAL